MNQSDVTNMVRVFIDYPSGGISKFIEMLVLHFEIPQDKADEMVLIGLRKLLEEK